MQVGHTREIAESEHLYEDSPVQNFFTNVCLFSPNGLSLREKIKTVFCAMSENWHQLDSDQLLPFMGNDQTKEGVQIIDF